MAVTLSALTREYLRLDVTSEDDLAGTGVEVAFVALGQDPAEIDWVTADSWAIEDSTWRARILIGPGGTTDPGQGDHQIWMRLTDTPEIIVRRTDTLTLE